MYYVDANTVMNWMMGIILVTGAFVVFVTLIVAGRAQKPGRVLSYLYMLSTMLICFGIVVAVMGFRGRNSSDRPWHFFLDMKYQPKYTAQGPSSFFSDRRAARLPPENTVPFDGTDYFADAGRHSEAKEAYLRVDASYYLGVANPSMKTADQPIDPKWENGKPIEGYFVLHIPNKAVDDAGGWLPLMERGREQFNIYCAACHGTSGRGGMGDAAYGIVGLYGLTVAPANITTSPFTSQPDGQLYHTIANGKGSMSAYGHQVKIQDRWAIVAHVRVLQFAHDPPGGK